MKKALTVIAACFVFLFLGFSSRVLANEGRIELKNGGVDCEGVSIWDESQYKIFGRCQGLIYPYSQEYDNYILWVKSETGETFRVSNIDKGIFTGRVDLPFNSIFITVEKEDYVHNQSNIVIAKSEIYRFDFPKEPNTKIEPVEIIATPSATPVALINPSGIFTSGKVWVLAVFVGIVAVLVFLTRK